MAQKEVRIAIVDSNRCQPKKCGRECLKKCPVVRVGKICIEIGEKQANISESLCIGCGICTKVCPFNAIKIINLPSNIPKEITYSYGSNSFRLYRLPIPRLNQVLGLIGSNGSGKSTALKILAGKIKPNFGLTQTPIWEEIIHHYRGSELQNYFSKMLENKLSVVIKSQYVDAIPSVVVGIVGDYLKNKEIINMLNLNTILGRDISKLSGGELQRFAIALACSNNKDVYMFDEPSSYLDIKQRLNVAKVIQSVSKYNTYVIIVEHDLTILDYMSDSICYHYGTPGAYGVITTPFSTREGINNFLEGYIPTENLRFRSTPLKFISSKQENSVGTTIMEYPSLTKIQDKDFILTVDNGVFHDSEIIVLLGENGTGKTTFIRLMAGLLISDTNKVPNLYISYKPQKISTKFEGSVRSLLYKKIGSITLPFIEELQINSLFDQEVKNLSGGELQRVALAICLGTPANIYLIDEPSAYLDSEQRIIVSQIIKRFIINTKKTCFIVEHDLIMATYLADKIIVFSGEPSVSAHASSPLSVEIGMNQFLKNLNVTFRVDDSNQRHRINKLNSVKDKEQKLCGIYYT